MLLVIGGCSTPNPEAPRPNEAHPEAYILQHAAEADADLESCKICHGRDFQGTGNPVPGCFSCHEDSQTFAVHPASYANPAEHGPAAKANQIQCRGCHGSEPNNFDGGILADPTLFDTTAGTCSAQSCHPSAKAHPTNWQGTNEDKDPGYDSSHRTVSLNTVQTSCALCHKTDGPGAGPMPDAPSCYSASYTNADGSTTGCHAGGFEEIPHDMPYTEATAHGAAAKADLVACQACHGQPGTTQFTGGGTPTGCATTACHPDAGAHPTRWQGSNDNTPSYISSHRNAGKQSATCSVCHDYTAGRTAPEPRAPSCFSADFTNSDGITTGCHAAGPTAPHAIPYTDGTVHGPAAKADLVSCQVCHGTPGTIQFNGGTASTGCSTSACHPDAAAHPTRWQGSNDNTPPYTSTHRNAGNQSANCSVCHDFTQGRTPPNASAPSCFSSDFTNADGTTTGCHATGAAAPHALPFTEASAHGPDAKTDLAACQVCHGTPGTVQFNGGVASTGCSAVGCHDDAGAHPTRWQGSNDNTPSYSATHRDAGATATACAICHNTTADAPGPQPDAPSCFAADFTNKDGVNTGCHAAGPSAPHGIPYDDPAQHGSNAKADLSACQACHGNPGTIQFNGGLAPTACSSAACHPDAGAHPTRWQGTNDNTSSYLSNHRDAGKQNTNCSICHDFTQGRTAPDPNAPSCFSASYTNSDGSLTGCHSSGPGAPHALPYLDSALHGPDAKVDLAYCQQCHADPFNGGPGSNPRFNVPLGNLINGCEDCHAVGTAHPLSRWTGPAAQSHKTAGNLDTACALCHGTNLNGGAGPACSNCHTNGDPLVDVNCSSCHGDPPDGSSRPNRNSSHSVHDALAKVSGQCLACHEGFGTNTSSHFDGTEPADIKMLATYKAQTGTLTYNAGGNSCNGVKCHGGETTPNWDTGTINVGTDCHDCHTVNVSQYNSPRSGRHRLHVNNEGFACTECHNYDDPVDRSSNSSPEQLSVKHFAGLDTNSFEGDPDRTIRNYMNYNGSSCAFGRLGRCHNTNAHSTGENW